MTQLSARFQQSPSEVRRYVLDYTLELQTNETLASATFSITSPTGDNPANFAISNVTIASTGLQVYFYASLGTNFQSYEVKFLATTNISQVFEDVVQFDIQEKT